ncbi:YkgJ family cysteine cluster protein [Candidatus Pacearchaeota archaeon]|nr:YkgJ family cysteine cluster protein [Candidatus Pacearchaeota archaeon]
MEIFFIVIDIIIILIFVYIFYFREFILAKREFKCLRCGNCCKLRVRLNKQDIKRIENAGYGDFLDKEGKNLKRINGYCKFLILDNGITSCRIQDLKPEICNGFPRGKGLFGKKVDIRCKACANKLY